MAQFDYLQTIGKGGDRTWAGLFENRSRTACTTPSILSSPVNATGQQSPSRVIGPSDNGDTIPVGSRFQLDTGDVRSA